MTSVLPEVDKAQSATFATSTIVGVAMHFNFFFLNIAEAALRTKVFKICCAVIALCFKVFFLVNSAIFY